MSSPAISLCVNDEDARDLTAATGGDQEAFGRMYDRHAAVVLSLCRHRLAAIDQAEDAAQETFIRAFGMLDKLDASPRDGTGSPVGGFHAWLYAIARRVCSEQRRASSRRRKHEGNAMSAAVTLNGSAESHIAENNASSSEQLDRLSAALDQLDDRERLAVHLHYLDADPARAAEEALNLSRSGYYKLLARAREKLAALMREVKTT